MNLSQTTLLRFLKRESSSIINAEKDSLLRSLSKVGKTPVAQIPLRGAGKIDIGS
jgi:hypothetical protein